MSCHGSDEARLWMWCEQLEWSSCSASLPGNHTLRAPEVTFVSGRLTPKAQASSAAGGSMCRRRTLCVAHVAAQPTGRYRTGRNMRPALASSRVAGCRAALRTRSRAFEGLRRSRTRAARSWTARLPISRRVSDWAAATIRPRVSGRVTTRTSRASLVTGGMSTGPRSGSRPLSRHWSRSGVRAPDVPSRRDGTSSQRAGHRGWRHGPDRSFPPRDTERRGLASSAHSLMTPTRNGMHGCDQDREGRTCTSASAAPRGSRRSPDQGASR